ncbi:ribonuclease H [Salinarchaeum sp. Harcht-Bsk1]|uniref:ribonuclease HI n=1 Tax=Salinarchaeum sp. Harcht-Bsk1 TaxID=1333523 RepID=UPI0003423F48|nr:ribonuclease HI [Salinarchaeum sp. Harcht-Bsk1]AGN01805.1 ribonuclease H [Salinarchaeum sp. Harcht-Bsk1]
MPVLECDVERARARLAEAGATVESGNTEHERWRATLGEATAVAYDDKVVIQGSRPSDVQAVLAEDEGGAAEVYFDGASRGNPGPAAIGYVIANDGGIVAEGGETIGSTTNNRAEYEALIRALEVTESYGFDDVDVYGDSELVLKQLRGEYDVNVPELRERRVRAMELLESFDEWVLQHVPRELNDRADALANEALDDA